jgi:hypothetical protein
MQILQLTAIHAHDIYQGWHDCHTSCISLVGELVSLADNPIGLHIQPSQAAAKVGSFSSTSPSSTARL